MNTDLQFKKVSKPMDVHFSVFNGHVNDADARARSLMKKIFSNYLEEVEEIERDGNGIMAVFKQAPTEATRMYTVLVFAYVNEFHNIVEELPDPNSEDCPRTVEVDGGCHCLAWKPDGEARTWMFVPDNEEAS